MKLTHTGIAVIALAACAPKAQAPVPPASLPGSAAEPVAMDSVVATVEQILAGAWAAGDTVLVRGRCLGYGPAGSGPPPLTRSDWQLEGETGARVWVVGAFPSGCTGTTPASGSTDIRAVVQTDTLLTGAPARRYLARLWHAPM